MKFLLRFLRRLAVPVLVGTVLSTVVVLLTQQYAQLHPLREPFDVLTAGLTGFWAVQARHGRGWRVEVGAGIVAGVLVGIVRFLLGRYLGEVPGISELLVVTRAAIAAGVGATLSRLLHQRVVL
jgi:hypothetical protein